MLVSLSGFCVAADQQVSADDPRLLREGRWDAQDPEGPRAEWGGAGLIFRANAPWLDLLVQDQPRWAQAQGDGEGNYLAVYVDDEPPARIALKPGPSRYRILDQPAARARQIRVVKRTEALCGRIQVRSVVIPDDAELLAPPERPARRIEIIGDSVTSGYGVEAASASNTDHPSTANATLAYGWLGAQVLDTDARIISWSGKGVYRNYDGSTHETMAHL